MEKRALAFAIPLLALASAAPAHDFSCRNEAAEIRCAHGRCRAETAFTPMQLTRRGEAISLCAYSGCWVGEVRFSRARSGTHFLQGSVRRTGPGDGAGAGLLSVMFSARDGIAQIQWNGFFSTLTCGSPRSG